MDDLQVQITEEIAAITDFLEQRFGRRSRWNGDVELSEDADNYGKALWSGSISINRRLATTDLRWRTEIHEALHHFSTGLLLSHYLNLPGWEEGVVEQLQRTVREEMLFSLNVNLSPIVFAVVENDHEFNRYIAALEAMRLALKRPTLEYYQALLATPIKDRPASLIELGRAMQSDEFHDFQRTFAFAFSRLRGE